MNALFQTKELLSIKVKIYQDCSTISAVIFATKWPLSLGNAKLALNFSALSVCHSISTLADSFAHLVF
jgi:hypothetical protein